MKEDMDKLDQLFEKALKDFEESPPDAVKSNVFNRILLFSTWQMIRKYFVIFMILLMISIITYFSGAFSSSKSRELAFQAKSIEFQQKNISGKIRVNPENNINPSFNGVSNKDDLITNNYQNEEKTSSSNIQQTELSNTANIINNKPVQNDKTNTFQIKKSVSNKNLAQNKEKISFKSNVGIEKSKDINTKVLQNDVSVMTILNNLDGYITNDVNNVQLIPSDNSIKTRNKKTPLLWSVGLNLGHSLLQSDFIKSSEQVSDDNFKIQSKVNFPSGFIGMNVRGEKKHLFFDIGLQYANFSEKINTNQQLYNEQKWQKITFLGQNTVIENNGSYWHYFYMSDSIIRILDSVLTWRIDTVLVSLYDTTFLQKYDTIKNPSWKNTYSFFEFPLNIGWMQNFGRIKLGLSTGPILSLLVGTRGKMPYNITNKAELIALNQEFKAFKLGLSWQISGLIDYQFSDRMLMEFSPYYRHTLFSIKSSATSATLKNNSFGFLIGLRYYF